MFPNMLLVSWLLATPVLAGASTASDPVTGAPRLAVRHGDIVESIVFIADFRRSHPHEKAVLLLPRITKPQQVILPAVAYTLKGEVWIHSYRTGDLRATATESSALDRVETHPMLHMAFLRAWRTRVAAVGADRALSLVTDDRLFPPARPSALPGDDDERQVRRAFARLKSSGTRVGLRQHEGGSYLVIEYEGLQYYWSPRLFSGYNGLAETPALPSLIAAVLFATDYHRGHPQERVALFLRSKKESETDRSVGATALFTKSGLVFVRDPRAGDLLTDLKPKDLARRQDALAAADAVTQHAASERRKARQVAPEARIAVRVPDTSVAAVLREFQQRGIEARPMGRSLIFTWAGKFYSYDGSLCRAVEETHQGRQRISPTP